MANGKGRDGRRESRWRRIIREHGRSGLGVREFCRRGNLTETAFYFWRKELQRRQVEDSTRRAEQEQSPRQPRAAQASFVPVRLAEEVAVQPAGRIEIELSSGRRVHVTAPVDRQTLADVLAVLEGRHPEGQAC
jgi:antitoxin component of MazEF toxin-antitoxin module